MAATEQKGTYISLAPVFGENSMETFLQALTENRRCMDCKREMEDFEGAAPPSAARSPTLNWLDISASPAGSGMKS